MTTGRLKLRVKVIAASMYKHDINFIVAREGETATHHRCPTV